LLWVHIDEHSSLDRVTATDVDGVRRLRLALGLLETGRAERFAFGAVLAADAAAVGPASMVLAKKINP
jgi:hypothetical protein